MVEQLNWLSLEDRHRASNLILMYKVVNNLIAVPVTYIPPRSLRYSDSIHFILYCCKLNIYQHSFFLRVVILWNKLASSVTMNLSHFSPIPVRSGPFSPSHLGSVLGMSHFGPIGAGCFVPISHKKYRMWVISARFLGCTCTYSPRAKKCL